MYLEISIFWLPNLIELSETEEIGGCNRETDKNTKKQTWSDFVYEDIYKSNWKNDIQLTSKVFWSNCMRSIYKSPAWRAQKLNFLLRRFTNLWTRKHSGSQQGDVCGPVFSVEIMKKCELLKALRLNWGCPEWDRSAWGYIYFGMILYII